MSKVSRKAPQRSATLVSPRIGAMSLMAIPSTSCRFVKTLTWRRCSRACPTTGANAHTGDMCSRGK